MENLKNYNKAHCKSCIFHPDYTKRISLSQERINEITSYLLKFECSHICHNTNLTCYGGLELQAKVMFSMGLIPENSVTSLIHTYNEKHKPIKKSTQNSSNENSNY